jgi:hypothetical protein
MGEITRLNPSALPAPTELERIELESRRLTRLIAKSFDRGGSATELRSLATGIESMLAMRPDFQQQITSIDRPATKKELADHLSVLRIAFPNAKAAGDGFSRILVERVAAQQPSLGALDWAIRQLIDHSNFMPSIAETLAAIMVAQSHIDSAKMFAAKLPKLSREISDRVAEAERDEARDAERRAARIEHARLQRESPA